MYFALPLSSAVRTALSFLFRNVQYGFPQFIPSAVRSTTCVVTDFKAAGCCFATIPSWPRIELSRDAAIKNVSRGQHVQNRLRFVVRPTFSSLVTTCKAGSDEGPSLDHVTMRSRDYAKVPCH